MHSATPTNNGPAIGLTSQISEHHVARERVYLASLDGLRFVAFLLVLVSHITPPESFTVLYAISRRGWIGVELFFVTSAFLFFTLFQVEYRRTGRIALVDFFIRRLLRVYPLMVAAPLLFMMLLPGTYDVADAWSEFATIATFGDNILWHPWIHRAIPFAGQLWTLSFEFQIYLVLPAFFYACLKLGRRGALYFLGAAWLLCVALRAHYAFLNVPHPVIYFNPLLRPDSVLLGMALALIAPRISGYVWTAVACLVVSTIAFFNIPNVFVAGPSNIVLYPAVAVMCGSLLWLAIKAPWLSRLLSAWPLVYLGKRSFGLYVFHVAANYFTRIDVMPLLGIDANSPVAWYVIVFALTILLATAMAVISYRFLERPFLILKDARAVVLSRPV